MSRKLGALALALGILVSAMGLKTVLTSSNPSGVVVIANGPDPIPPPIPPGKKP